LLENVKPEIIKQIEGMSNGLCAQSYNKMFEIPKNMEFINNNRYFNPVIYFELLRSIFDADIVLLERTGKPGTEYVVNVVEHLKCGDDNYKYHLNGKKDRRCIFILKHKGVQRSVGIAYEIVYPYKKLKTKKEKREEKSNENYIVTISERGLDDLYNTIYTPYEQSFDINTEPILYKIVHNSKLEEGLDAHKYKITHQVVDQYGHVCAIRIESEDSSESWNINIIQSYPIGPIDAEIVDIGDLHQCNSQIKNGPREIIKGIFITFNNIGQIYNDYRLFKQLSHYSNICKHLICKRYCDNINRRTNTTITSEQKQRYIQEIINNITIQTDIDEYNILYNKSRFKDYSNSDPLLYYICNSSVSNTHAVDAITYITYMLLNVNVSYYKNLITIPDYFDYPDFYKQQEDVIFLKSSFELEKWKLDDTNSLGKNVKLLD
tara:strand:+ start:444 stop:1745 length:1302 start_codon:yes stop_codon:yes gene_type:complete